MLPPLLLVVASLSSLSGTVRDGEYRVEDFLWSGSGEGSAEGPTTWVTTTTVFQTRTLVTTVYPTPVFPLFPCSQSDCISPTPASSSVLQVTPYPSSDKIVPDQRYWLVTIIKLESSKANYDLHVFEKRLAKVYYIAFHRQQEKHLRLDTMNATIFKRATNNVRKTRDIVDVKMHHIIPKGDTTELVYSVNVAGRTVDAAVAVNDMKLVSDNEVSDQLGYPVLTKAKPYAKPTESLEIAAPPPTWTYILVSLIITIIILAVLVLYYIKCGKRKSEDKDTKNNLNERSQNTQTMVHNEEANATQEGRMKSSLKASTKKDASTFGIKDVRPGKQTGNSNHKRSSSPTSYLSMPSVRSFPRAELIPGPLDILLGTESNSSKSLSRHCSEAEDPGVIGPAVWDLHCHRINKLEEQKEGVEASARQMRRRFHELLDDAFSLFGSQCPTPQDEQRQPSPTFSNKSITKSTNNEKFDSEAGVRSRGAWEGTPPAPARPLSAGPFHKPTIEPTWILTDSQLHPSDPAVPLIEAIKQELDKFPSVPSNSQL